MEDHVRGRSTFPGSRVGFWSWPTRAFLRSEVLGVPVGRVVYQECGAEGAPRAVLSMRRIRSGRTPEVVDEHMPGASRPGPRPASYRRRLRLMTAFMWPIARLRGPPLSTRPHTVATTPSPTPGAERSSPDLRLPRQLEEDVLRQISSSSNWTRRLSGSSSRLCSNRRRAPSRSLKKSRPYPSALSIAARCTRAGSST